MKLNKIVILSLFIMLVCFIGAASATEDVNDNMTVDSQSIDDVDASVDEVVSVESNDNQESDGSLNEQSSSSCSGTPVNATNWSTLRTYAQSSTNYTITLTGNSYNIGNYINFGNNACIIGTSKTSDEILSDEPVIYYVNSSLDSGNNDGSSWDNAFYPFDIFDPLEMAIDEAYGNENIIIYVADYNGTVTNMAFADVYKNVTFIGQGIKSILSFNSRIYAAGFNPNDYVTFINFTIDGDDFGINTNFINCTFIKQVSISKDLKYRDPSHVEEYGYAQTYFMNFTNCVFKDVITADALVTLYKYGAVNFNNCTFENITADSLVYHNDAGYFEEDGISFKNCTFINCKYNGIVDSLANFDDAVVIEDCNYDGDVAVGTTFSLNLSGSPPLFNTLSSISSIAPCFE